MDYNKNRVMRQQRAKMGSEAQEEAPPLEGGPRQYLNFRLDILSNEAMKGADKIYRRDCGLDVRHLRILRLIGHHPGITFSRLAEETRLERGLTSRIVTALTTKGLVERQASAADARQFHLHLTEQGQALQDHAAALADQLEELLLSPLAAEERAALFASLDKLTTWVRQGGGLTTLAASRKRPKTAS